MFVASGLYKYATSSNNATGGPSSRPNVDEPTPANTRVKRRPRRGTAPSASYSKASPPSPPLTSPLVDAEPSLPPPPPYASIATGSTSEERKQAQDAKVAIIEEILKEDDLYKLLGCKKSSKPEEIRRGFLNRSRSCHPDKFPNHPPATSAFQKVSFAYETLSKPSSRRMYDVSGRSDFAAAMNADSSTHSSGGGLSSEDTLNGVLYSVFCEFMEGDFEMIRVLVNALNEGNPSMNLGEEAVDSIEGAFKRLREIMLAGKRYLSIIKFELMRLHEIQQSLRQLSYFNITGRLKLTIQLARVTINIPLAIDNAMKAPEGEGASEKAERDRSSSSSDDSLEDVEEEDDDEDAEEAAEGPDAFGVAPEDDEDEDDDDDPAFLSSSSRFTKGQTSRTRSDNRRASSGLKRKSTIRGTRPRDRIHGRPASHSSSDPANPSTASTSSSSSGAGDTTGAASTATTTAGSRKARGQAQALQKRGLLPNSAVSLLRGVVKVLETSEAWMPGTGVPQDENQRPGPG